MFNPNEDCALLCRFEDLERAVRARYLHMFATSGLDREEAGDDEFFLTRFRLPECQFVLSHDAGMKEYDDQWYFQLRWPKGKRRPQLFGNVSRLVKISARQAGWALAVSYYRSTEDPTQSRIWLLNNRPLMLVDDTRDEEFTVEEGSSFGMLYPETFESIGLGITKEDLDEMSEALEDAAPTPVSASA